ncbi:MAG TPA: 16S rRNA (guanine(527)-N(7))-methyltransferase RsmG [Blastocatellia bacterium]|nr:16S rRNA (guanine(527)-N(7))-methyltransferase RsmG [Blastocatellia bacterium]
MTDNRIELFRDALDRAATTFSVALTAAQVDSLVTHYEMLSRWNRRINLTRIIDPVQAAQLHYGESLWGGRFIGDARAIVDIGSGAGFPGVALAVLRPDAEVTALEANQKKAIFLTEAADAMKLKNFRVARVRLEEFDLSSYDLLTSRALDRAEVMIGPIVARLAANQRLMLYAARDLAQRLSDKLSPVEIHPIPQTESRVVALFGQINSKQSPH